VVCDDYKKRLLGSKVSWTVGFPFRRTDTHGGLDRPFGLRIAGANRPLTGSTLCGSDGGENKPKFLCSAAFSRDIFVEPEILTKFPFMILIVFELGPLKRGHTMTLLQSFMLGVMVAWTPSLVLLGWCLQANILYEKRESASATE
jgi:hypothetical protein